ncbi:MAG: hypothetical protein MJE77_07850 [Proteobacteria bacterium]|nr:hypothetical protein [Pseudomonadota bacterium]
MFATADELIRTVRGARWANLVVVNLRILIGFAFIPAGLKKVLGQPFTDPANTGLFHDFLHSFHATGGFYRFVGMVQLVAALLLMTQRFAALGTLLALPVLTAIAVFCWSTGAGVPTRTVVTLMLLGTVALFVWDRDRWRGILVSDRCETTIRVAAQAPVIDIKLWQRCGAAILVLYSAVSWFSGGVYRPRGIELDNPAFYILPLLPLFPLVTFFIDRRRHR